MTEPVYLDKLEAAARTGEYGTPAVVLRLCAALRDVCALAFDPCEKGSAEEWTRDQMLANHGLALGSGAEEKGK